MKTGRLLGFIALGAGLALASASGCSSSGDDDDSAGGGGSAPTGSGTGTGTGSGTGTGTGSVTDTGTGTGTNTVTATNTVTNTNTVTSTNTVTATQTDTWTDSTSCSDAHDLVVETGWLGVRGYGTINPASDKDFFKFTTTADGWYIIYTDANPDDDPAKVDTVLRLWDETGATKIGEDDDAFPRASTDSEMYFHAPAATTYCLELLEFSDWSGGTPEGDPGFTYATGAVPIDFGNAPHDHINKDTEPNDSTGSPQALALATGTSGQVYAYVAGMFDGTGADVDVFSFSTVLGTVSSQLYFVPPAANPSFGSTKLPGEVTLLNDSGGVLGKLNYADGSDGMSIPLDASTAYYLSVSWPDTTHTANDFYFMKFFTSDADNEQEQNYPSETGTNDILANAEAPNGQVDGQYTRYFVMGTGSATDVDYWGFTANLGHTVNLACGAVRSGSGLLGLTVTLVDSSDAVVQNTGSNNATEVETATDDIYWTGLYPDYGSMHAVEIDTTGTYYLKVEATGQDTGVLTSFYRCGIHVAAP